jgi:hypothetical protein
MEIQAHGADTYFNVWKILGAACKFQILKLPA